MPENNKIKLPNIVIIGKGPLSKYLYNFFLKAYNYEEIVLQYHDNNVGTANSLIDGLKNFGWIAKRRKRVTMPTEDRTSGETYKITINQVTIEKIGAIRGL